MRTGVLVLALAIHCQAAPIYYLATGQTGAQTQIDVNHTSSWILTPSISFDFGGGLFTMKDGQTTSADVILSIYLGSNSGGPLIAALNLSHAAFCAPVGTTCGQFQQHQFFFNTPIPFTAGATYFATLTSIAADTQSLAYFIKNNTYFISNQTGIEVLPSPVNFGAQAITIPEPQTYALLGVGLSAILWGRRRRMGGVGSGQSSAVRSRQQSV